LYDSHEVLQLPTSWVSKGVVLKAEQGTKSGYFYGIPEEASKEAATKLHSLKIRNTLIFIYLEDESRL
jgi:hypothetical protein